MKKLWIIPAALCFLVGSAGAQEIDPLLRSYAVELNHNKIFGPSAASASNSVLTDQDLKNFNYQTRAAFYADFGNIPITGWEFSDEFDKISFMKNGVPFTAYYDLESKLVGTISNATVDDLPAHAMEKINKWYKGYTVGDIVFFDDNELNDTDMLYYDRRFDDEDKYFVELKNDKEDIVVQINYTGDVSFFTTL